MKWNHRGTCVIPADAESSNKLSGLDSGLRRNDELTPMQIFLSSVCFGYSRQAAFRMQPGIGADVRLFAGCRRQSERPS
jgi:hypothetical protein